MRIILLFFFFFTTLLSANEMCNKVQLITLFNSQENREKLKSLECPDGCEIVELGRIVTLRSKCIQSSRNGEDILKEYRNKYPGAVIVNVPKNQKEIKNRIKKAPKVVVSVPTPKRVDSSELCYTVQLISTNDTQESREYFKRQHYPKSCQNMKVGNYLTVRCECLDTRAKAQERLPLYQKDYSEAMVLRTAKSRFNNKSAFATAVEKVKGAIEVLSIATLSASQIPTVKKPTKKESIKKSVTKKSRGVCHSIQLVSKYDTKENRAIFAKEVYPASCKMMKIGNYLTERCECLDTKSSALKKLPMYKKEYPEAIVVRTARYRFDQEKKDEKKIKKVVPKPAIVPIAPVVAPVAPIPLGVPKIKPKKSQKKIIEPMEMISVESEKTEEPKKNIKKQKIIIKKKKHKKKKHKKSFKKRVHKKKKSKKNKYVKRHKKRYFYDKYLDKLKSKRGIGPLKYRYSFGGRVEYDGGYANEADSDYSSAHIRRARLKHEGNFVNGKVFYKIAYDFIDDDHYKDLYIGYKNKIKTLGIKYRLKLGNLKVPFSLERYGSSKNIPFMEKALTSELSLGRKIGAELLLSKKINSSRINLFSSVFTNSIGEREAHIVNTEGFSLRATYLYTFSKQHLLSLGTGYIQEKFKGGNIKFSEAAETDFMQEKYVSEKVKNVDLVRRNNAEFLYIYKQFSLQAEYTRVFLDALEDGYYYSAHYAQVSYFLYGQGRTYKASNSSLSKIKLERYGAVEFAFRYSFFDLNSDGIDGVNPQYGGYQRDYNSALNYYINDNMRLMFNYVIASPRKSKQYNGILQLVQARLQFAF